jgi:hypothetical protein
MAVTAAQALAKYSADTGTPPQTVVDSAANILASLSGLLALQTAGNLASVAIGGANVLTAAKATALTALTGIALSSGATLQVTGPATALLGSNNAPGLALATSVLLTGATSTVSASQAETLATLPGFSLAVGTTLKVSDSVANLLNPANAAGLAKAMVVVLNGTGVYVTAAQAAQLVAIHAFKPGGGATLLVSDTAANLLASGNVAGVAMARGVVLTGTNVVGAAQAKALSKYKNFTLASGATLKVSDSAANLAAPGNAGGLAIATAIVMTGSNIVTAAQATRLAAVPGLTFAPGATLQISDNTGNLVNSANAAGLALATSVQMTGKGGYYVSAAQADKLAALPHFSLATGVQLLVSDTAGQLLDSANASGLALASKFRLIGTNSTNAAQAETLASLPGFHLGTVVPGTLTVIDSGANLLLPANTAGVTVASAVVMTGTAIVNANQAIALGALAGFALASGATLSIADTGADIQGDLNGVQALVAKGLISAITLTDATPPSLEVSAAQYAADAPTRALIASPFTLIVDNAAASAAAGLQANSRVTAFSISDSAAQVASALDALNSDSKLTAIALTDNGTPVLTLTNTQYTTDRIALGAITSGVLVDVVGSAGETLTARDSGVKLDGSAGNAVLNAAAGGGDTLVGGAGDTLNGDAGSDTFVFGANFGIETINGFLATSAAADVLQFSSSVFADWAHVLGAAVQNGSDVVITLDATDKITLTNVSLASLSSANARFV